MTITINASTATATLLPLIAALGLGACVMDEELMGEDTLEVSGAPAHVYINDNTQSITDEEGLYILDPTPGQSSTACFSHEFGHYSIGSVSGYWMLFVGPNCQGVPTHYLGTQTSSDPREAGPVDCHPRAVTVANTNSIPASYLGDYIEASTSGGSAVGCWNHANGTSSLGNWSGWWLIVQGTDCVTPSPGQTYFPLDRGSSCDPTESSVVEMTYAYYP